MKKKIIILIILGIIFIGFGYTGYNIYQKRNTKIENSATKIQEEINQELQKQIGIPVDFSVRARTSEISGGDVQVISFRSKDEITEQGELQIDKKNGKKFVVFADFTDPNASSGGGVYKVSVGKEKSTELLGEMKKEGLNKWKYVSDDRIDIRQYSKVYIQYQPIIPAGVDPNFPDTNPESALQVVAEVLI